MKRIILLALTLTALGACGGNGCPYQVIARYLSTGGTVECCEAVVAVNFNVPQSDADVDVSMSQPAGSLTPVDAWLTRGDCQRLFETGSSAPLCEVLIGPVGPGSVSERRRVPSGTLRIWVRTRTAVSTPVPYSADAAVWANQCTFGPR